MHACLDDLVIALYVSIDELLGPRRGPGRPPKLADSELICLAVAQVLLGYRSERRWLRAVGRRLGHLFPYVRGGIQIFKKNRVSSDPAQAGSIPVRLRESAKRMMTWHGGRGAAVDESP